MFATTRRRGDSFKLGLLGSVALLATAVYQALQHGASWWWSGASLALVLGMVWLLLRTRDANQRAWRRVSLYAVALARVSGEKPDSGHTGEAFAREGHLFQHDLNVLGSSSLFDRLATTRTAVGQRGLARLLLDPATTAMARERQAAIRELEQRLDLRERVALLGRSKFEDVPAAGFEFWLDGGRGVAPFAAWLSPVLLLLTLAWIVAAAGGWLLHVDGHLWRRNLEVLFGLQWLLCLRTRTRVNRELEAAQPLAGQTLILRDGLRVLREERFESALLQRLQREAQGEDAALKALERWLAVLEQRPKEWFYVLSLLLCLGTQAAIALERWKRKYGEPMRRWIETWAEFEALIALATYAAEHEGDAYPELVDEETPVYQARSLRHPLLARDAVANDVALGGAAKFLLISGSNMAGKSTLLRAMGANVVLALAGAPVAAESMRCGVDAVGASISVSDSLIEGKSKFLAEVERLKAIVELARAHNGRTLFLIDEILAGTNSADRKAAAEATLRALVRARAVGAISTHDLTLTEIAEMDGMHGENVHMASPDDEDPLGFDYRLKPGKNRTTNAMAIVRMMGLG